MTSQLKLAQQVSSQAGQLNHLTSYTSFVAPLKPKHKLIVPNSVIADRENIPYMALYLYTSGSLFEEVINNYLIKGIGINAYDPTRNLPHLEGMNSTSSGTITPVIAANDTAEVEGSKGVQDAMLFGSSGGGQGQAITGTSATGTASPSGSVVGVSSLGVPSASSVVDDQSGLTS